MSIYPRGKTWWIYIVHHGRRIRQSAETGEREEAQRRHDELKARLWQRRHVSGATWREAVAAYLKASPRDDADKYRLGSIDIPDSPLSELTAAIFLAAIAGKSPATHNRYVALITAILNFSRAHGLIESVPIIPRRKTPPATFRWLTRAEWAKLERQLPKHLLPLARFAIYTGLRQFNVTHLRWEFVDMRRRLLTVPPQEAKAGKVLTIPLSDAAMGVLRSQAGKHSEWVFPYKGGPLGRIKSAWGKACARAGVTCRWHDLRHTWASWAVQAGVPLQAVQELGGWATYAMVLRYAHLSPEHLRKWVNVGHKAAKK